MGGSEETPRLGGASRVPPPGSSEAIRRERFRDAIRPRPDETIGGRTAYVGTVGPDGLKITDDVPPIEGVNTGTGGNDLPPISPQEEPPAMSDASSLPKSPEDNFERTPPHNGTKDAMGRDQGFESISDLESQSPEVQRKLCESLEAWKKVIDTIDNGNQEKYYLTFKYKGEKALILVGPTKDLSNPDSEILLAITLDGIRKIQATPETQEIIKKQILSPKDGSLDNLEPLSAYPDADKDLILAVIEESKKITVNIKEEAERIKALEISTACAKELNESLSSKQNIPTSK